MQIQQILETDGLEAQLVEEILDRCTKTKVVEFELGHFDAIEDVQSFNPTPSDWQRSVEGGVRQKTVGDQAGETGYPCRQGRHSAPDGHCRHGSSCACVDEILR